MTPQIPKPSLSLLLLAWCGLLAGCRSPTSEPAPPPASYELASAPPGARGARAAGTDAAPPQPTEGMLAEPGGAEEEEEEAEPEAEPESDGGLNPDAGGGVAL